MPEDNERSRVRGRGGRRGRRGRKMRRGGRGRRGSWLRNPSRQRGNICRSGRLRNERMSLRRGKRMIHLVVSDKKEGQQRGKRQVKKKKKKKKVKRILQYSQILFLRRIKHSHKRPSGTAREGSCVQYALAISARRTGEGDTAAATLPLSGDRSVVCS